MNIAIVGTNFISDRLCSAARAVSDVTPYAVYSRKLDTGRAFAERNGIPNVFCDYDEMLRCRDIDAVYVASPNLLHPQHSTAALQAGKHVLCEKMIAPDYPSFLEMRRCADSCGRILLEAMRPSHDPFYLRVKELLPKLGKIRRAHLEFCQYSSRYDRFKSGTLTNAFDPEMKNSALADIGIYPLSVAHDLFGKPVGISSRSVFLHNGFEGSGCALLDYGDMLAEVVYSKISQSTTPSVIEGEYGSLHIDKLSAPRKLTFVSREGVEETVETPQTENNMIYELENFRLMALGTLDPAPYLLLTDITTRTADLIIKNNGIFDKCNEARI